MIMMIVVVVCLVIAGIVLGLQWFGNSSKISSLKGRPVWMLCSDPKCGASYEIDMADYFEYIQKNGDSMAMSLQVPAMECPTCWEMSAFRAVKCSGCGNIIFYDTGKCPECETVNVRSSRIAD